MAKVLDKIGRIKCHCCGSVVILKRQVNGNPIYTCQECDFKAQAFSSDSGKRLVAQCVDRFAEAANDAGNLGDAVEERSGSGAAKVAGKHSEKIAEQMPQKKSLGAALSDALGF